MKLVKSFCRVTIALIACSNISSAQVIPTPLLLDPYTQPKFVNPLPIPAVLTEKSRGAYTLQATQFTQHLGLFTPGTTTPLMTTVWGYNGTYPGPTIVATKGTPTRVYFPNRLTDKKKVPLPHLFPIDTTMMWALSGNANWRKAGVPLVPHLHGGHVESASDGLPEAWYTPSFALKGADFLKGDIDPYFYINDQDAATLWYHDHTLGITRLNVYAGLAGFYLVTDKNEKSWQKVKVLPAQKHDIPLVIQDRLFTSTGQLYFPTGSPEFFGDFILVNGKTWPFLNVEPREYRFRVLNGSDSRFYHLTLSNNASFKQIGSDDGFLPNPIAKTDLLIAPGERMDIIVDFSTMNGQTITLLNDANGPYPFGDVMADTATTGKIMQFRVNRPINKKEPLTKVGNSPLSAPITPLTTALPARKVLLHETEDANGNIMPMLGTVEKGAMMWGDTITENPDLNATEIWEIYNNTADAHPIHLHLVKMQLINREQFTADADPVTGALSGINLSGVFRNADPGEAGWKDTWITYPGEVTRVIAKFDVAGRYVWHCHILSHEDHEMMRPLLIGKGVIAPMNAMKMAAAPVVANNMEVGMDLKTIPNPFVNKFTLKFNLQQDARVRVNVYNGTGQLKKKVYDNQLKKGPQQFFIGEDTWANGIYFIEIAIDNQTIIKKMSLQR
jgi:spore coat protein A